MRKHEQSQLLEFVKTLEEAQKEARLHYRKGEGQKTVNLLSDCQGGVASLLDFIIAIEGEGTKTEHHITTYYEMLYKTSVEITNGNEANEKLKELTKQLSLIKQSIKNDLKPNKFQILFLPYQASMWDSMESVWLAAKDDPQCEALVMPIPYYDKLPDGSLGAMKFDGGKYPEDVSVIDWEQYDIELSHPDVIVIHNPYDEFNRVTSVHPSFYSKRLKELTDCLVYIPYFVVTDEVPEHFCTTAGVLYADKVILQSEDVKDQYVAAFQKFEKETNSKGLFGDAKTKFIALGSPKFDKVQNGSRDDYELPTDWCKLIENPDGTCKKVILYNTSVGAMLEGNEQYLKKLLSVFDIFRNRDDTVLWWRPHPLAMTTYESMRPQLADFYKHIVDEYKRDGFGIYDDTPDLHRAIQWSDAYYGDGSSLIPMYQVTEKPIMVQSAKMEQYPTIIYYDKDLILFVEEAYGHVYQIDRHKYCCTYVKTFAQTHVNGLAPYHSAIKINKTYYLVPWWGTDIKIWNDIENTEKSIAIKHPRNNRKLPLFDRAFQYGNSFFATPWDYDAIISFDTQTNKVCYFDEFSAKVKEYSRFSEYKDNAKFGHSIMVNNKLVFTTRQFVGLVIFDIKTKRSEVIRLNCGDEFYENVRICHDGNNYWLVARNRLAAIRVDSTTYECAIYSKFPDTDEVEGKMDYFSYCFYALGYVWLTAFNSSLSYKINVETGEIFKAEELDYDTFSPGLNSATNAIIEGEKIILFTQEFEYWETRISDKPQNVPLSFDQREACYNTPDNNIMREKSHFFNLEYFIGAVQNASLLKNNDKSHSGEDIYKYLERISIWMSL